MKLIGAAALLCLVAGCASTSSGSAASDGGSPSAASPSVTASATSAETETCQERVKPWLDEVQTLDSEVNGDGISSATLQDHVSSLGAAYETFKGVCSNQLRQAAAEANFQFATANVDLRICVVNASKCTEYEAKAQDALRTGLSNYPKVNDLIYP